MTYVTALPHPKAPSMRRTTFVCRTCNRTWSYMLSAEVAAGYAVDYAGPNSPGPGLEAVVAAS